MSVRLCNPELFQTKERAVYVVSVLLNSVNASKRETTSTRSLSPVPVGARQENWIGASAANSTHHRTGTTPQIRFFLGFVSKSWKNAGFERNSEFKPVLRNVSANGIQNFVSFLQRQDLALAASREAWGRLGFNHTDVSALILPRCSNVFLRDTLHESSSSLKDMPPNPIMDCSK